MNLADASLRDPVFAEPPAAQRPKSAERKANAESDDWRDRYKAYAAAGDVGRAEENLLAAVP